MSDNNITIKEFKMWLQGVEEMQDDAWTPDAKQWARIRAKIDSIDETEVAAPPVTYSRAAPYTAPASFDVPPATIAAPQFDIPQNVTAQPLVGGVFGAPGPGQQPARLPTDLSSGGPSGSYSTPFA